MDPTEMELPCKTETVDVWCDGGNGEDSGVEVLRAASCGSSVLSGYSETEGASECGSDTYTANTVKALAAQLHQQLDLNETWSESSSTHEGQPLEKSRPSVRSKKPTVIEARQKESRPRLSGRTDTKPKIPAKPTTIKPSTRPRKSEPVKPKTSENDGRWPFSAQKPSRSRATSAADPARKSGPSSIQSTTSHGVSNGSVTSHGVSNSSVTSHGVSNTSSFGLSSLHKSMTQSFGSGSFSDFRSSALDKYGTLPRRKKKDTPEISPVMTRSGSREPSLNRAATLRRQTSREKDSPPCKSLPPYPRGRPPPPPKTLIFHETAVQTVLTARDLDGTAPSKGSGDVTDNSAQTEHTARLDEEVLRISKEHKMALDRLRRLLGLDSCHDVSVALLDDLERHVTAMSRTVNKQREELYELHTYKIIAQRDLEKSLAVQKSLVQQQQMLESEHAELQDFLQAEKSTLSESLVDADDEITRLKEQLRMKDEELSEQQDQCKHLVRLCEQRRQENMSLEARLAGLEQRSHDVLRQQGAAVSGAAVALTSLGARLDSLVDQLAVSYHVADKDLEDVIFHNEAYSPEGSPDLVLDCDRPIAEPLRDVKPPRKAASFLNAVLGAIRSATQSHSPSPAQSRRRSSAVITPSDQNSDSLGLLDSELTLDPLSKSSESGDDAGAEPGHSQSLHNLSAAILRRQRTEEAEEAFRSLDTALPPDLNSLVDQVILVDNLVTKLLKVMRIVQMDNDTCLDQIADQRAELDERYRMEAACRQESEQRLQRVESELQDARVQLNARIQQLEDANLLLTDTWRRESQRQYATIDHALETLQSMQDVVDQYPPLAKLQQQMEDCNFRTAAGDDLNANSPNGQVDNTDRTNGGPGLPTDI